MLPVHRLKTFWGKIPYAWRVGLGSVLIARGLYTLWSLVLIIFIPVTFQNLDVLGEPVLRVFDLQTSQGYVYSRAAAKQLLTFEQVDRLTLRDQQTGSLWEISSGSALVGPLAGTHLGPTAFSKEQFFTYLGFKPHSAPVVAIWERFDAIWYLSIARYGYGALPEDTHFLPTYPFLIWLAHLLISNWTVAALFVSHGAAIVLVKVLYEIYESWGGAALAQKGVAFFLLFPASFFLFGAYAEPVFIMTTLLALQQMHKQNWLAAGFWAAGTILGRLQGITIFLSLAYVLWQAYRWKINRSHLMALGLPVMAVITYVFIRLNAGAASIVPLNERGAAIGFVWPWENFYNAFRMILNGDNAFIAVLNIAFTILFTGLIIYGWKKIPLEYSLYSLACMLLLVSRGIEGQPLYPMIRYALTLPPAFFFIAQFARTPWRNRLIVFPSLALALFLSAEFFIWSFVS